MAEKTVFIGAFVNSVVERRARVAAAEMDLNRSEFIRRALDVALEQPELIRRSEEQSDTATEGVVNDGH
jgi:hypothetical protein